MLRYLDTTPLAEPARHALAALRQAEETDQGPVGPINQQRAMILEKVRAAIAPNLNTDMRRDPRTPCAVAARVRIGLARIRHELAKPQSATPSADDCDRRADRGLCGRRSGALEAERAGRARLAVGEPRRRSPIRCGR